VKHLFAVRLVLDFIAAGLLLVALAYYWLNNASHEFIGTGIFVLLIAHGIFNRRWWGGIAKQRRESRNIITTAMNLSLLITMLSLVVTSVIISQSVFSFLPIRSDFTSRQIHAAAAYWALIIVAFHLGWHWHMIAAVVSTRLGLVTATILRTVALRLLAVAIAAYGVYSSLKLDIGSKLFLQMSLLSWDFAASAPAFFVHHIAIIGLYACVAHYILIFGKAVSTGSRNFPPIHKRRF
jgi:uncharacterized protein DUF4405